MFPLLLALLAAPPAIGDGGTPLYNTCDHDAEVVTQLSSGAPVRIKYSISGDLGRCFRVTAGEWNGFVLASALTGLDDYDRARRLASDRDLPQMIRSEVRRIREHSAGVPAFAHAIGLLDAGRPAQALRVIESSLLPSSPSNANLLALAGLAAWQADDPRKAAAYWSQSLAVQSDPQIEKLLHRAQAELQSDSSSERVSNSRFLLRYDGASLAGRAASQLLAALDEEFARLDGAIGCPSADPLTVIVQTRNAFRKSTGASEWSGGQYDGRVRVALDDGRLTGQARIALAHELVHACLARRGFRERWFQEGMAQRWSGERASPEALRQAATLAALPAWDDSAGSVRIFYAYSYLAVDHLYRTLGDSGVRDLLRRPQSLPAPSVR